MVTEGVKRGVPGGHTSPRRRHFGQRGTSDLMCALGKRSRGSDCSPPGRTNAVGGRPPRGYTRPPDQDGRCPANKGCLAGLYGTAGGCWAHPPKVEFLREDRKGTLYLSMGRRGTPKVVSMVVFLACRVSERRLRPASEDAISASVESVPTGHGKPGGAQRSPRCR